jgi:hypothetical protein
MRVRTILVKITGKPLCCEVTGKSVCPDCRQPVIWVRTPRDEILSADPFTADDVYAEAHFLNCRERRRRKSKRA